MNDVEAGDYPGGLGPEGTDLDGGGKYPVAGPTGVTGGQDPPSINSFGAFDLSFHPYACGSTLAPGTPVLFWFNITSPVTPIPSMGDFYSYIDNAGPVRVNGAGWGTLVIYPRETQEYTLYSMNADGMTISSSCTIGIYGSTVPIPILSPITGTYNTIIGVVITVPGYPNATIYYTSDQTEPTYPTTGTTTLYTGPITITDTSNLPCGPPGSEGCNYLPGEEINAIAVVPDFAAPSEIGTAIYVVDSYAATPVITPPSGTYDTQPTITITDTTIPIDVVQDGDEVEIYFTTDGSTPGGDVYGDPSGTSVLYNPDQGGTGPFVLPLGVTQVNAVAVAVGYSPSAVATNYYGITFTVTAAPGTLIIQPGSSAGAINVTITSVNGYSGTVDMTCSGLPPGDSCTFNPSSVPVNPVNPGQSTITISVGQNQTSRNSFPLLPGGATLAVALCFLGLRKRRRLQILFLLAVSVIGLGLFTGCGTPGVLPDTVTVTVTATDSNGGPVVSSTFILTQMQSQ